MEFLSNIRKKSRESRLLAIEQEADHLFTVQPSQGGLSYAYNGVPIVAIDPATTAEAISQRLQAFKQNYINFKKNSNEPRRIAAAL